jgi:hypothetical protein
LAWSHTRIFFSYRFDNFLPNNDDERSALVDTDFVWGVDCDTSALTQARMNVQNMELAHCISFIQAKVSLPESSSNRTPSYHPPHQPKNRANRRNVVGRGGHHTRPKQPINHPRHHKIYDASLDTPTTTTTTTDELPIVPDGSSGSTNSSNSSTHRRFPLSDQCVDTVITNPPFGTKSDQAGIDIQFVLLACRLARRAVYSFHKTTTRDYVIRTIQQTVPNIHSVSVIAEMKFDLGRTYQFHQKASVDVAVDLIRVELVPTSGDNCGYMDQKDEQDDGMEHGGYDSTHKYNQSESY